jgi:hypothetical protein
MILKNEDRIMQTMPKPINHDVKRFGAVLSFAMIFFSCKAERPLITALDPHIGVVGQPLTIMGESFGDEQGESYISIAGVIPTRSSYHKWSDTTIIVVVPDFGESGLLYVHRQNQKSNPVLFAIQDSIPVKASNTSLSGPNITSISPESASIGDRIVIQGSGFGNQPEESATLFTWSAEKPDSDINMGQTLFVSSNSQTGGYESWSGREIVAYVSDGAASGVVEVQTPQGISNAIPFEVVNKYGTKTIKDKKTYSVQYSADVRVEKSTLPNILYLWLPRPLTNARQLNKELIACNITPFINNYKGVTLFRLQDLKSGSSKDISVSYLVDVYAVETKIQASAIKQTNLSDLQKKWVQASNLIPSHKKEIIDAAAAISRERNPYLKAKAIYNYLLREVQISHVPLKGGAVEALAEKKADSYQAALLFSALCRASQIPAVPVAGVLLDQAKGQAAPHFWAEFWLDGIGWIPVDPVLGSGIAPAAFKLREDYADYYFGNIDNARIVFSHGETALSQMDVRGRIATRERAYSFQNVWEESSDGLESYSTYWSDITITGVYSN